MNKLFLSFCLLFTSMISFAANKITMVTYFPVPYVAYSKVTPKNQLDIGLTSSCQMNLGCAESGYSLNATTANLNRNRLDLNSAAAVSSTNVTIGSGYGPANIDFAQNLRVGTLDRGYSLEANTMTVESLTLFASHMKAGGALFPDCRAKSGEETVSWQKLKLKDKEEVYLMCGKPAEVSRCEPTSFGRETYFGMCPSGQTGTITYTWNYDTCKYDVSSNTCRSALKKCLTKALYCGTLDVSRGAVNDGTCSAGMGSNDCQRIRLGQGGFFVGHWADANMQQALRENGYETNLPFGCSLGSACSACTPGERYFISNSLKGQSCYDGSYMYGPGSCRTLYVFQYAMCGEMSDCSTGTEASCTTWKDGGGNLFPFLPGPVELAIK